MICVAWQSNYDGKTDVSGFSEFARSNGLTFKHFPPDPEDDTTCDVVEIVVPSSILREFIERARHDDIRIDGIDCSTEAQAATVASLGIEWELNIEDDDPGWNVNDVGVRVSSGPVPDDVPWGWYHSR